MSICLFIDFIAVLHSLKNSNAFVNIPLLIRPKGMFDFKFAGALKIVSLMTCSQLRLLPTCETQGVRANIHKHTQIRLLP